MRSSRLVALLLELSQTRSSTVAQLAAEQGVSSRTVERDIAALQVMGVPLWTRTGPGGGVGLVEGWRSPLTGMTAPELQALLLGHAGARGLGLEAEFQTARLKMLAATAATGQSAAVRPAQERFLLDHEAWFTEPERPDALPAVAQAVWAGTRVRLRYRRPGGAPALRVVDPLGLVLKGGHWYLVAGRGGAPRTYRVTRILSAEELPEPALRPEGFSLAQHWSDSRAGFEASLHTFPVQLTVPRASVALLNAATGGAPRQPLRIDAPGEGPEGPESSVGPKGAEGPGGAGGDGRCGFALRLESLEIAASQLLAVPGVEVLAPASLRAMMLARAQELLSRHQGPDSALEGADDHIEEEEPQGPVEQSDP